MEPNIIDFYNETPYGVNVIDKLNEEYDELQKKYDELKDKYEPKKTLEYYIISSIRNDTDYDMALLFHKMYEKDFKCSSIKKNIWYFFDHDEKKWKLSDGNIELRLKLNDILKLFEYRAFNGTYHQNNELEDYYKMKYLKICNKIKNISYKNKIIKECKDLFYDKDFNLNNEH